MRALKIGFIGAGNMGRALIAGLLRSGARAEDIGVGEPVAAARDSLLQDFGILATADNALAVAQSDVVVFAVKPQQMSEVLTPLAPALAQRRPLLLSIAAGVRIADLQRCSGADIAVVRAMPNRPALVGAGASGLFGSDNASPTQRDIAERVLRSCGVVVWVEREELIDTVTALSGSGPAYFFLLTEAMAEAAVQLGLDAKAARALAIATLNGAGTMALQSDGDLVRLRREVTSKGGTTEAALQVFDAADLRGMVARAVAAAAARGRELAEQFAQASNHRSEPVR